MKSLFALIAATLFATLAHAWQPTKTVEAVIGFTPGSGNEIIFRALAAEVEKNTGVRFVIEHKPGAGGVVGTEYFYRKPADGHALLVGSMLGIYAMDTVAVPDTKARTFTIDDFSYVMELANANFAIVANINDPVNNVQDFVNLLRSGQPVNMGSLGGSRLVQESLKDTLKYGDSVTWIQHRGPAEQVADVAGGHLRFSIAPASVVLPFTQGPDAKVKVVALTKKTGEKIWPTARTLNTVLPGMVIPAEWGLLLPKGADPAVVAWYQREFAKALRSDAVQKVYEQNLLGYDPSRLDPKTFEAHVRAQHKRYAPMMQKIVAGMTK
jgi:tripartite-type tricarboxylate transporter receptor subunit TctC